MRGLHSGAYGRQAVGATQPLATAHRAPTASVGPAWGCYAAALAAARRSASRWVCAAA